MPRPQSERASDASKEDDTFRVRELGKRERLERIVEAARELFLQQGFAKSTIRQIARQANVAVGTVFRYATSKEELVVLALAGPLERVVDEALQEWDENVPPVEQLLTLFGKILDHINANAELSRILVKEMTFLPPDQTEVRVRQANVFLQHMVAGVQEWQSAGLVRADLDADVAARAFFALNFDQVTSVLSGEIEIGQAKTRLRESLNLVFEGLQRPGTDV